MPAGAGNSDKHDVFVDKQNRTWVSNLAALQIHSLSEFNQLLSLMSSRRHSSDSSSHSSHGCSSCVVTLLVVADIPSGSALSSARNPRHNPSRTAQSHSPAAVTRICSKLSFVEVGSSAVANQPQPAKTVSAGPLMHQLSRSSTSASIASSFARCSSAGSRRQSVAPGVASSRGNSSGSKAARGKAQVMHHSPNCVDFRAKISYAPKQ